MTMNELQSPSNYGIPDYSNKTVLAPMVRVGTLPFRLLCLNYGADIVYSEELIAHRLKTTRRSINEFSDDDGKIMFSTNAQDHPNVAQLGAPDAVTALEAASLISRDVDGIDLNMGCPIHFSVQGGMGSALLTKPKVVTDILSTLKRNLNNSITCKIRLLDSPAQTLDLIRIIEMTGVSAIAVHARHVKDRPREPAYWNLMKEIVDNFSGVPLIANGSVFRREDISRVKTETGVSSVMIARGALWGPSIFSPSDDIDLTPSEAVYTPLERAIRRYIRQCWALENSYQNTKYTVMQMMHHYDKRSSQWMGIQSAKSFAQICDAWNLREEWEEAQRNGKKAFSERDEENEEEPNGIEEGQPSKKLKSELKF